MTAVTRYPTTDTAVSGTWANPTNVQADDGAVAAITRGTTKNTQDDREQAGYGFDSEIPAGATINSVAIEVEHRVASTANVCFLENLAYVGGVAGAVNSDSAEPTTLTARVYANYARPGGGGWTRDDLLDANFKTRIRGRNGNNASSNTWEWDYIRVVVDYTTGSGPVTVTPGTAALVLAAFAAVVTATANVTVTPSTASLTTAAFAPTVTATDPKTVTPTTASLTTATFAPTVTASDHKTVTPATKALSIATFAPTVTGTGVVVTRYPTTDTAVTGTWTTPTNVQADNGNTASTNVANANVTKQRQQGGYGFDSAIPAGATINSVALEVEHRVTTAAGIAFLENEGRLGTTAGAMNSDGTEPTVLTARAYAGYARPGGGSWTRDDLLDATFNTRLLARSGNDATSVDYHWDYIRVVVDYTAGNPVTVTPGAASLTLTTFAPTVTSGGGTEVTPTTAALTLATFAPTVTASAHQTVTPTTAALTTQAFAPTVSITGPTTVEPAPATLTLTTFAPSVVITGGQEGRKDGGARLPRGIYRPSPEEILRQQLEIQEYLEELERLAKLEEVEAQEIVEPRIAEEALRVASELQLHRIAQSALAAEHDRMLARAEFKRRYWATVMALAMAE